MLSDEWNKHRFMLWINNYAQQRYFRVTRQDFTAIVTVGRHTFFDMTPLTSVLCRNKPLPSMSVMEKIGLGWKTLVSEIPRIWISLLPPNRFQNVHHKGGKSSASDI